MNAPPFATSTAEPSSTSSRWTDAMLDAARQQGDEQADALAAQLFAPSPDPQNPGGRLGYNRLVDFADYLLEDSELLLVPDSRMAEYLLQVPEPLRTYYSPSPAPTWVDADKLALASRLWSQNSLAMLAVLYAASLPACYLIKNGIPALYQTDKLRDHKYIFQRIYETGLMLDAVMDPSGLHLTEDLQLTEDQLMLKALQKADPAGGWTQQGSQFVRTNEAEKATIAPDSEEVQDALEVVKQQEIRRYVWGKGYIAARKVRMLHASMRFLLLNPAVGRPRTSPEPTGSVADRLTQNYQGRAWPASQLGKPVNQEDLAYTLLTFGYLLPKGLEHWGCEITLEQKEAFLHLWKLIGHVMGLREDLMTDRWDEAEELFELILSRQGGTSEQGIALTDAVTWFLKNYLPPTFGIRENLPVTLILDQLGWERGRLLFRPNDLDKATSVYGEMLLYGSRGFMIAYYRFYQRVTTWLPFLEGLTSSLFHRSAEELINSWRDEYDRRPFYVPKTLTVWERCRGVNEDFMNRLRAWREEVFVQILAPLVLFGISGLCGMATIVLLILHRWNWAIGGTFATFVLAFSAFWKMEVTLPQVFAQRPKLDGVKPHRKPGEDTSDSDDDPEDSE